MTHTSLQAIVSQAFWRKSGFSFMALSALCLFSMPADAAMRVVRIANGNALPGQTSITDLRLSEVSGFAGGDFSIEFNPDALSVEEVDTSGLTDEFLIVHDIPSPGLLTISMASFEGLVSTGEGMIARITFRASSEATPGGVIPVSLATAHWYTELSVRQEVMGDSALFAFNGASLAETSVVIHVGSAAGQAGSPIEVPLLLSEPHNTGRISGILHYDPAILSQPVLQIVPTLTGWTAQVSYLEGSIQFVLQGAIPMTGIDETAVAVCRFNQTLRPSSSVASLTGSEIQNDHALKTWHETSPGQIDLALSPTETPTLTPTPTPTVTLQPTPTVTEIITELENWQDY